MHGDRAYGLSIAAGTGAGRARRGGGGGGGIIGPNGEILTGRELERYCDRKGLCMGCGTKTHKVKALGKKPLSDGVEVWNGICLRCNPNARGEMTAVTAVAPARHQRDPMSTSGGTDSSLGSSFGSSAGPSPAISDRKAPSSEDVGGGDGGGRKHRFRRWKNTAAAVTAATQLARNEPGLSEASKDDDDDGARGDSEESKPAAPAAADEEAEGEGRTSSGQPSSTRAIPRCGLGSDESAAPSSDHRASGLLDFPDPGAPIVERPPVLDAADAVRLMRSDPTDRSALLHGLRGLVGIGPGAGGAAAAEAVAEALREVAQVMGGHPDDAELQGAGCLAVWRLTSSTAAAEDDGSDGADGADSSRTRKADAVGAGCLECVLSALRSHPEDADLASFGIGAMAIMAAAAAAGGGAGGTIAAEELLGAVHSALRTHPGSAEVMEWSARSLHALTRCDGADVASLRTSSAVRALLGCMRRNVDAAAAQEWAVSLLWLLLIGRDGGAGAGAGDWESDEAARDLLGWIAEEGGSALCADLLRSGTSSERLKGMALALLRALVRREGRGGPSSEEIGLAKSAMEEYPTNGSIQEVALSILADAMPDNGDMIAQGGGIVSIVNAMEIHGGSSTVQESASWILWTLSADRSYWTDPSLLTSAIQALSSTKVLSVTACNAMANFALLPGVDLSRMPIGAIVERVASALRGDEAVQPECAYAGCRTISNVCTVDMSKVDEIVKSGGVDAVVNVMSTLRSDEVAQDEAIGALCQILSSSNDGHRKAIIAAGGIDLIATAMGEFNSTESIQVKGLYAFCMLAMCQSCSPPMVLEGAIDAAIHAMGRFSDNTDIQTRSCLALRNLSLAANANSASSAARSINSLVELIQRSDSLVLQKEACGAIYAIIANCKERDTIPMSAAFSAMVKILDDNKGDEYDRPFNAVVLNESLGGLEILTEADVGQQYSSLHATSEMIDVIVSVVYASLDAEVPNADLVEGIFAVILNMSNHAEYERDLVQCGCVVAVIDGMHEMKGSPDIEEMGCEILSRLCIDNLEVKYCIMESDGIELIVSAMMNYPENATLQTNACATLAQLTMDEESRFAITLQGGVVLIVGAMQNLPNDAVLQEKACSALCNLVVDMDDKVLLSSNIVETVHDTMRRHIKAPTVQERALGILQNLSMKGSAVKDMIVSSGGIEATVSSIRENMTCPEVQEHAFTTLWSLAVLDGNQVRIAEVDGTKAIILGMMACVDLETVQRQACGCLCTLSANPRCLDSIKKCGGIDAILFAMWYHYSSEPLLTEACRALCSFTVNTGNEEVIAVKETVIDAIIRAMMRFPDSAKLLELTCLALRNLSLSATNVSIMRQRKSLEPLLHKASAKFPGECSQRANQVITRMIG